MDQRKKAAFKNLGCKVNTYETEALEELLVGAGYELVPFEEQADVYVINTCSVTQIADKKSRQMIRRAKRLNPDAVVVAAGCFVQHLTDEQKKEIGADHYYDNDSKEVILSGLHKRALKRQSSDHTRFFMKIQDGCNAFCTYCIIPYVRGRERSKKREDILGELAQIGAAGMKEVVLTGIHLDSFDDDGYRLADLCEDIEGIGGIERVRLSSLEPRVITEEFAGRLLNCKKLCPHFHLSLQSGCEKTLKRMNRKYTVEEFSEALEILRDTFDGPAVTTDVIVGFPGETPEDFEESFAFCESCGFYEMHVFPYSAREGTRAASFPDQITRAVKSERTAKMIALSERMSKEFREKSVGKNIEVLFEEEQELDGMRYWTGFTRDYIRIAMKSEEDLSGKIVTGRLGPNLLQNLYKIERFV